MSAYFTISGAYYSGEADRVVYLDRGLSINNIPQIRSMNYGDGYSLLVPVAPILRTFSASFSNREPEEIIVIDTYFELLQGAIIPDFVVNGETINAKVVNYSKSYMNGQVYSLTAQIVEEFR